MKGIGPDDAYELISSDLLLDGSARLNLATFVTTSMPPMAARLMAETADKNMIDKDEYPQTAEIEARCVSMIANLWNSPHAEDSHRLLDHRFERGGDAGGPGPQVAVASRASRPRASRPTAPTWSPAPTCRSAGRSSAATSTSKPGWSPSKGDRLHLTGDAGRQVLRREHHRRGGGARVDLRRQLRAGQGDRGCPRPAPAGHRPRHPDPRRRRRQAGSWPRSSSPTSSGTSGSPGCSRSTPPVTSTGSSTPGSAGWSGETRRPCRRS